MWLRIVEDLTALISQLFSDCDIYLGCFVYLNKMHTNWALNTFAFVFEKNEVLFHIFNNCLQQMIGCKNWHFPILLVSHPF